MELWMPPLVMGVLITAAVLETCASEEPGEELTHIAERSSWDEQEDCPDKVTVDLPKRFLDKIKEGKRGRFKGDGSVLGGSPASHHT